MWDCFILILPAKPLGLLIMPKNGDCQVLGRTSHNFILVEWIIYLISSTNLKLGLHVHIPFSRINHKSQNWLIRLTLKLLDEPIRMVDLGNSNHCELRTKFENPSVKHWFLWADFFHLSIILNSDNNNTLAVEFFCVKVKRNTTTKTYFRGLSRDPS